MIKKRIEYTFFTILNINLSSFLLNGLIIVFIIVFPLCKMAEIIEKYYHMENFSDNVLSYSFIFGILIFSILFKILIFPILYKINFLSNIKDFLKKFATDKKFLIKILFSVLIFDIIVYLLSVFLLTGHSNNFDYIYHIKDCFMMFLLTFGGVLPCYLSFLLWYKITHSQ